MGLCSIVLAMLIIRSLLFAAGAGEEPITAVLYSITSSKGYWRGRDLSLCLEAAKKRYIRAYIANSGRYRYDRVQISNSH